MIQWTQLSPHHFSFRIGRVLLVEVWENEVAKYWEILINQFTLDHRPSLQEAQDAALDMVRKMLLDALKELA